MTEFCGCVVGDRRDFEKGWDLVYEGGFDEVVISGFERLLSADYGAD